MNNEIQPRFREYLRSIGTEDIGNVKNYEYITWISRKWQEWRKLNGIAPNAFLSKKDHRQFDEWLSGVMR